MKIVDHAIRGKDKEICGYMTGFAKEGIFYILDAVELPIIGSDSRVEIAGQMGDRAHVYTSELLDLLEKVGRSQKLVGWYHSHPGFGCWLSGIDCNTQKLMQMVNKTFCALVIDPYRTLSNRKVDIGCFMCFQNENNALSSSNFLESIPLYKSEDYGVHANKYYRLEHSYFQSNFDAQIIKLIYKNYWVDTLSANKLLTNEDFYGSQVEDMSQKVKNFAINKSAQNLKTKDQNELHQKKLDIIANLNTQTNVNLQNELMKTIIFSDK